MEGSAHYTLSQLRAWKNRIWQEREQLDREELFVEQRMAGACWKKKNFKRKRKVLTQSGMKVKLKSGMPGNGWNRTVKVMESCQ